MVEELIKRGALDEAVAEAKSRLKNAPTDPSARILYFQLCCLRGKWAEAAKHLEILGELDAASLLFVQIFRDVLVAEQRREAVFAGTERPLIAADAPAWVGELAEALAMGLSGQTDAAEALRAKAFDAAEARSGSLNSEPFTWLADADTRFGPVVEHIVRSEYRWAPWTSFASITCDAPHDLRDLVWMPAHFVTHTGEMFSGFIPARYPLAEASTPEVLLGRLTDWQTGSGDSAHGFGRRMVATDANDFSLCEVRELGFDAQS